MQDLFETHSRTVLIEQVTGEVFAGCSVLTIRGCRGSGKTRLARHLATLLLARDYLAICVSGAAHNATQVQDLIEEAQAASGTERLVLLVDDAHACPADLFSCLWTLVERRPNAPVIQLVLLGDAGPWPGLDAPGLEDLRGDSASCYSLGPFEESEAAAYVRQRLGEAAWYRRGFRGRAALRVAIAQSTCVPADLDKLAKDALASGATNGSEEPRRRRAAPAAIAVACTLVFGIMLAARTLAPSRVSPIPLEMPGSPRLLSSAQLASTEIVAYALLAPPQPETIPATAPAVIAPGPGLVLVASAGDDMRGLYERVYRGVEPPPYQAVLAVNRSPVRAGELVIFPEPPHGWSLR